MDQAILIGETDAGHIAVQEDLFAQAHAWSQCLGWHRRFD